MATLRARTGTEPAVVWLRKRSGRTRVYSSVVCHAVSPQKVSGPQLSMAYRRSPDLFRRIRQRARRQLWNFAGQPRLGECLGEILIGSRQSLFFALSLGEVILQFSILGLESVELLLKFSNFFLVPGVRGATARTA
jgi:hypothetical protein